jgi:hypothetical protein
MQAVTGTFTSSLNTAAFTANALVTLGTVANVKITGGTNQYYLQTDGTGNLTWAPGTVSTTGNGVPAGANTQVQFTDGTGNFQASANFVFNNSTNKVTITGNLDVTDTITGNLNDYVIQGYQPYITTVGTLGSLGVTGNITAGNVYANSGTIGAASISGTIYPTTAGGIIFPPNPGGGTGDAASIRYYAYSGEASVLDFTVTNDNNDYINLNASGGVTIVGTLSVDSIVATGNISVANLVGSLANGNSNVNIPASNGNVTISSAGNANIIVVTGTGVNVSGTLNATGNANVGNIGTATAIITTGNITTINSGLLQNGTSNHTIASGGNHTFYVGANATSQLTLTSTGANIAGTANVTGNANVGNLGTSQVLASANITAPQLISNVSTGTAPLVVTSTTQVANLNVATAGTAGTVTTAAQPNITSVGTLSSLAVTGNITAGNANVTGQLISTVTTGTAPIVVSSTTKVANLNADFLDGYTSATAATGDTIVLRDTNGNITANNFTGNTNGFTIGYLNIPQVSASNTTIALTDAGKHYYSTTAGNLTLTIPNNATTSFATGTAISIVVQAAGNVLVNAASGVTLYMAGSSSAGNRVVGTYGMATLMKVASDTWFINGTGVS